MGTGHRLSIHKSPDSLSLATSSTATICPRKYVSTTSMILPPDFVTSSVLVSSICLYLSLKLSISGDIVESAGGNYSTLSISGGVVAIHIKWICNLDFDFMENCLPE